MVGVSRIYAVLFFSSRYFTYPPERDYVFLCLS
nr:MAG TPA: hypothetical protein [Bacteriophage sp.]